ncbi:MAG: DNA-binding protein, partial [Candidatus Bathyarchaeia archaeon]
IEFKEVIQSLKSFAQENNIDFAIFYGIGALKWADIAFYDLENKKYLNKRFDENLEIVSMLGNVSTMNNSKIIHAHVCLGRKDYSTIAGHFNEGEAISCEIVMKMYKIVLKREKDEITGLNLFKVSSTSLLI